MDLPAYNKQMDEQLAHVKEIINDPNWTKEKEEPAIVFYKRMEKGSSFAQIKSVVTIKGKTVEEVQDYMKHIRTIDENTPKDQREGCLERRVVKTIEGDANEASFYYIAVETSSRLVSSRDFLMYQKAFVEGDKCYLVRTSIVNDEIKAPVKKYVRANMFFQAFVSEPCEEGTKLTFLCHADPSGNVPAMIYNVAAINQGYSALRAKQALEK